MKSLTIFVIFSICLSILSAKTEKGTFLKLSMSKSNQLIKDNKSNNIKRNPDEEFEIEPKIYEGNCFIKYHGWLYDLYKMTPRNKNLVIKTKEGKFINFNICYNIKTACTNSRGLVVNIEDCILYSNTWSHDKKWNFKTNPEKNTDKLILNLAPGSECVHGGNNTITYEIECDPLVNDVLILNEDEFNTTNCSNTIKLKSKYGCKSEKFTAWYKSFGISKEIVGAILGIVGLFFLIFGKKFFKLTSSIILALFGGIILKSLLSPFFSLNLFVALAIGIVIAYFTYNLEKFVNIMLAVIIGYMVGTIAYNFIVKICTSVDPDQLYLMTLLSFIAIFLFFTCLGDLVVVIATSLIGSYCAIRGLSLCLGGFPDETYTSRLIIYKEFNQLDRVFSGKANMYLLSMLLLFCFGVFIQTAFIEKHLDEKKEIKEEDDDKEENKKLNDKKEGEE